MRLLKSLMPIFFIITVYVLPPPSPPVGNIIICRKREGCSLIFLLSWRLEKPWRLDKVTTPTPVWTDARVSTTVLSPLFKFSRLYSVRNQLRHFRVYFNMSCGRYIPKPRLKGTGIFSFSQIIYWKPQQLELIFTINTKKTETESVYIGLLLFRNGTCHLTASCSVALNHYEHIVYTPCLRKH